MDSAAWNNRGREYLQSQQLDKALECFDNAIRFCPNYASAFNNKGLALKQLGKYLEAISSYETAIKLEPTFEKAWFNLGAACHQVQRHKEAIKCCERTLELNPHYFKAWYKKGSSLLLLQKYEEALHCFEKVLELSPGNADAMKKRKETEELCKSRKNRKSQKPSSGISTPLVISESPPTSVHTTPETSTAEDSSHVNIIESDIEVLQRRLASTGLSNMSMESLKRLENLLETFTIQVKYKRLELEKRELSSQEKCIICLERDKCMICIPCGHLCLCNVCSKKMSAIGTVECPVCRKKVDSIIKVSVSQRAQMVAQCAKVLLELLEGARASLHSSGTATVLPSSNGMSKPIRSPPTPKANSPSPGSPRNPPWPGTNTDSQARMFGGRGTGKPGLDRRDSVDHSEHTRRDSVSSVGSLDSDYTERVDHTSEADAYVSSSEDEFLDESDDWSSGSQTPRSIGSQSARQTTGPSGGPAMFSPDDRSDWLPIIEAMDPAVAELRTRTRPLSRALAVAREFEIRPTYPDVLVASAKRHRKVALVANAQQKQRVDAASEDLYEKLIVFDLIARHLGAAQLKRTADAFRQELAERGILFDGTLSDTYEAENMESRLLTILRSALRRSEQLWSFAGRKPKKSDGSAYKLEELLTSLGLIEPNDENKVDDEVDVWAEPKEGTLVYDMNAAVEEGGLRPVRAGTLNRLVEKLTDEVMPDLNFLPTFLLTYRSFTTPKKLLEKLKQRFSVPIEVAAQRNISEEQLRDRVVKPIQLRVVSVIKRWVDDHFYDVDDKLAADLRIFLTSAARINMSLQKLCSSIITNIDRSLAGVRRVLPESVLCDVLITTIVAYPQSRRAVVAFQSIPPAPKVPKNIFSGNLTLYQIDPEEVARQMTLIQSDVFNAIQPFEFLNLAWTKPSLKHRAANILRMTSTFNQLSHSVSTSVVQAKRVRDRAKTLEFWIKVADSCRALNNYEGMMAVVSGTNSGPVLRLKYTRMEIPKSVLDLLVSCEAIVESDGSFNAYRKRLISATPPILPYLGIHLSDLVFIEDGNKDNDGSLINFAKRRLLFGTITQMQQYQQTNYNLQPVAQIQELLKGLRTTEPRELMKLSLLREPREAARSTIQ